MRSIAQLNLGVEDDDGLGSGRGWRRRRRMTRMSPHKAHDRSDGMRHHESKMTLLAVWEAAVCRQRMHPVVYKVRLLTARELARL